MAEFYGKVVGYSMKLQVSYKKLWHLLIEKDMTRQELRRLAGVSSSTIAKVAKNENINTDVLLKICEVLSCNFGDIMDAAPVGEDENSEMLGLIKLKEEADKSPYKARVVSTQGGKVAVQNYDIQIFDDAKIVLDYAVNIERVHGCRSIAVYKEIFDDKFFDLSSGFAGEVAQKLVNYGFRFAVIGDFSGYTSKALQDFIYESNKGRHLYFAADEEEALRKLGDA